MKIIVLHQKTEPAFQVELEDSVRISTGFLQCLRRQCIGWLKHLRTAKEYL